MNYLDIFWKFLRLGCTSFGGPVAHLMYFRRIFVVEHKWLSEEQYSNIVALCQTLPGPASSQVGFSLGLLRGGIFGGLLAFVAFTLPSVLLLVVFANYLLIFSNDVGQALLHGLVILAFAVVLHGLIGMGKNLCRMPSTFAIAVGSFVISLLITTPLIQMLVIFAGALVGYMCIKPDQQMQQSFVSSNHPEQSILPTSISIISILSFVVLFLVLPYLWPMASDFYRSGALVFGGGHVVLPLLEEVMVNTDRISQANFLAGYGATQAVPGPIFSFAAYLGFLLPEQGGLIGVMVGTIFIFLPGFLLVLALLPHWQKISHNSEQGKMIAGANAAVVGLLAAALYDPIFTHAINDTGDLAIAAVAYTAISRFNVPVILVLIMCITAKICLLAM